MGGARLKPLKRWQWVVLAALWLPGPIALLWNDYPRAEPWRQEFIRQRGRAVEVDRETAYLRVARQCQTGDKYDLISPQRRVEYLRCMDARKGELDAKPPLLQAGKITDGGLRVAQLGDHAWIEGADDAQKGVVIAAQLDHGSD